MGCYPAQGAGDVFMFSSINLHTFENRFVFSKVQMTCPFRSMLLGNQGTSFKTKFTRKERAGCSSCR